MPHALIVFAEWVGEAVFDAVAQSGFDLAAAHLAMLAAEAATVAAEVAAVYAVNKLLAPKIGGDFGTQLDWKADPQAGLPYAIGRTAVAGNIVLKQSAGGKNSYLNTVTVYTCAGPIDSYESFLVNGVAVSFGTDGGQGASGFYQNRMWRVTQLGAAPESSYLHVTATGSKDTPGDHSGMASEWTSSHKLSGLAADLWILQFNSDKYAQGVPQRLTVGKWVKAYDPRLDSSQPGGSGSQRADDESTWTWTENPYLHALTWLLGRKQNGIRIIGVGIPISAIDVAAFVEGANVADANGWTCGGLVYSTDDKYEVLKALLQAGGGKPMRLGAKISCLVNTPRVSLATLTAADVVGDVEVAGGVSRRDRINTIWPKYREEDQSWQMVTPDDPVSVTSYFTADGGQRSRAVEYPLVQDVDQVAQLARYDIEDSRELAPISLPCKPIWMGYKPGDVITATEAEWGLAGQDLLILKRTRDPVTLKTTFICRTETAGKHPFALGETGTAPSTPALGLASAIPVAPGASAFVAVGVSLSGTTGSLPGFRVTGTSDNDNAASLAVRYRVHGTTDWSAWPLAPLNTEHATVVDVAPLIADALYDVQVAYVSARGAPSAWTDLGQATAGAFSVYNVPFGANAVVNSEFLVKPGAMPTGWALGLNNTGLTLTTSFVTGIGTAAKGAITGTPAVNTQFDAADQDTSALQKFTTPVLPGDLVGASARVAYQNCSGVQIFVVFYDGAGSLVSSVSGGAAAGANVNGDTVDPGAYGLISVLATVPATARWAQLVPARAKCSGAASPKVWMMQPMLARLPAGQTSVPLYQPGPTLRDADVTIQNTAAAISGQGTLATQNQVTWASQVTGSGKPADNATQNVIYYQSSTPGSPTVNDIWVQLSGSTPIAIKAWNGSAWVTGADLTSGNTAAAITGQSAWATYGTKTPTNVLQFLDSSGHLTVWTALPGTNTALGMGVTMDRFPFTTDSSHIYIAAFNLTGFGASAISISAFTCSGLSADTSYGIVYNTGSGVIGPIDPNLINTYVISPDNWVFLGVVRTQTGGGTYTSPEATDPAPYQPAGGGARFQFSFA